MLVNGFKMTVSEVIYLSDHGADFGGNSPANSTELAPFRTTQVHFRVAGTTCRAALGCSN